MRAQRRTARRPRERQLAGRRWVWGAAPQDTMRVAVLGAGALGSLYGAWCADAGHDVTLVARRPHVEAIHHDGLTVRDVAGGSRTVRLGATDQPSTARDADVVLVACKGQDTSALLEAHGGRPRAAWSVQNGARQAEPLVAGYGPAAVGCSSMVGATLDRPGVVTHTFAGATYVGALAHVRPGSGRYGRGVAPRRFPDRRARRHRVGAVVQGGAGRRSHGPARPAAAALPPCVHRAQSPGAVPRSRERRGRGGGGRGHTPGRPARSAAGGQPHRPAPRRSAGPARGGRPVDGRGRPDVGSGVDAAEPGDRPAARGRRRVRRAGRAGRCPWTGRAPAAGGERHRVHARRRDPPGGEHR